MWLGKPVGPDRKVRPVSDYGGVRDPGRLLPGPTNLRYNFDGAFGTAVRPAMGKGPEGRLSRRKTSIETGIEIEMLSRMRMGGA